ncbi:hypothetical protein CAEBREN_17790 [Caenorhabditis brenneri]|uniref:C2H2-type domain-containing protein n=1 Tax=Caenorhabditis brenneri TaxID=135651 RepID=G0PDJ2_CAEBE|nr:hypothetical protein CAEBREN_17790 [Caenorhabditis brenneri]
MVSTHSSQYITDFTPVPAEPGKSPLALLAKTCETIGLPEGSGSKKSASSSPQEKKEDASKIHHHHRSLMMDQQQSSTKQSSKSSPRSTPQSKEPTLTFPGLPKPSFPMGMPPMGFNPFFNPMMAAAAHYQMPMGFPGAFPMGPAGFAMGAAAANRMPCPFAMMRQPCQNPACLQCPSSSNAAKNGQMNAEMMAQFAAHPLFSMYAGMMPGFDFGSNFDFSLRSRPKNDPSCQETMSCLPKKVVPTSSYQALLAASASAAAASAATSPTDYSMSKPSTSTPSTSEAKPSKTPPASSTSKTPQKPSATPTKSRFPCNWVDSDVPCGKVFEEESELTNHVKKMHAPSPSSSSTSSEPSTSSTGKAPRSSTTTPQRFNPYGKPVPTMVPPMGMNMNLLPFSLQAMYGSRLMPTVATHQ